MIQEACRELINNRRTKYDSRLPYNADYNGIYYKSYVFVQSSTFALKVLHYFEDVLKNQNKRIVESEITITLDEKLYRLSITICNKLHGKCYNYFWYCSRFKAEYKEKKEYSPGEFEKIYDAQFIEHYEKNHEICRNGNTSIEVIFQDTEKPQWKAICKHVGYPQIEVINILKDKAIESSAQKMIILLQGYDPWHTEIKILNDNYKDLRFIVDKYLVNFKTQDYEDHHNIEIHDVPQYITHIVWSPETTGYKIGEIIQEIIGKYFEIEITYYERDKLPCHCSKYCSEEYRCGVYSYIIEIRWQKTLSGPTDIKKGIFVNLR